MESPTFFVDRSLGRLRVPRLLRADGWDLVTLAEHYGVPDDERVDDVEWLGLAGANSWPVLMMDDRIRYRSAERATLLGSVVIAFCLASGNLTATEMAECFISHRRRIWAASGDAPAIYAVSRTELRRVDF